MIPMDLKQQQQQKNSHFINFVVRELGNSGDAP